MFEVTPNNINFGEFPRNQFIQRQPVIPFAPVQHSVPVGHHFIPATIAQSRQQVAPTAAPTAAPIAAPTAAPALVEVARSAPVAAPVAVPAPTPFAFPVAAPVSAPLPVAR